MSPGRPDSEHPGSRLEFETLISDLSSRFINLPPGEVDRAIEDALRRVCELLGIDLAVLWQWAVANPGVITPTHTYAAREGPRNFEPLRQEQFPWVVRQMLAGRKVCISSLEDLPAEAAVDRESGRVSGILSNLTLPLAVGGEPPVGALAFNTLRAQRDWPDALVKRLQLVAQVFTNALSRRRHELSLRESEARLAAGTDLAGLAFYEVDFGEGVVFIDDRFRDICGVPPEREEGLQALEFWMEHLHPDDRQRVLDLRRQLHDGKLERLNIEYRFQHPTQGEKWFHHIGRVVKRDAAGRTVKSFGVIRDITERRRREEELRRALEEVQRLRDRLQVENVYLREQLRRDDGNDRIVGESEAVLKMLAQARRVAATDATVLITGETGTGKELLARAIHDMSGRSSKTMVTVNCAALPPALIESELFGREKGAYTGAMTRQMGRFEMADGSSLFLDEIGDLPLDLQAKLLRVLQDGQFERLGSNHTLTADVRVIAATNRDLGAMVRDGRFRADLFHRLNVYPIEVPPLRARVDDIPLLVWRFVQEFNKKMGKSIDSIPRQTMERLKRYPWPGNVRELRNLIERAMIVSDGRSLTIDLPAGAAGAGPAPVTLEEVERKHILDVLESVHWRISGERGAAEILGLRPTTLHSRMKKLGISRRQD